MSTLPMKSEVFFKEKGLIQYNSNHFKVKQSQNSEVK